LPVFKYAAQTLRGKRLQGEIEAIDDNDAKAKLRSQKLIPLKLVLLGDRTHIVKKIKPPGFIEQLTMPNIKTKELQIFTRQFATLINAGIPVVESFGVLTQGSTAPALREMLLKAKASIEGGTSVGDS
jgi:type IV pilus assembly protein PilC